MTPSSIFSGFSGLSAVSGEESCTYGKLSVNDLTVSMFFFKFAYFFVYLGFMLAYVFYVVVVVVSGEIYKRQKENAKSKGAAVKSRRPPYPLLLPFL